MKKDSRDKEEKNFLLYIPKIVHENYNVENNRVTLYFSHNKLSEKFARWLTKKSNVSDIELDENCSSAWLLIDGERNIYEIALLMSQKTYDTEEVSIERLVLFMRYVTKKGWVKFNGIKTMK